MVGYRGVAQFGSALEWGSRGRKFDSCHSDHKKGTCCFASAFFGYTVIIRAIIFAVTTFVRVYHNYL